MTKIVIITLGCKQNKYESDCMAKILKDNGYEVSENLELADIYIINTCAVTSEAEKKSRQYIAKCNKLNPKCKIIVCGCSSENNIEQFEKNNVYSIFGTEGKQNILDYIKDSTKSKETIPSIYNSPVSPEKTTTRENLKIQDGCNNFCSYCLIPYLRGRSRSRDIEDIVSEAKVIAKRSHEIVLTGIDISSYSINGKSSMNELMLSLKDIPALISFGSLESSVITEELMKTLAGMSNFSPHFHLSLQSGDNGILKLMNRHYTTDEFYKKVQLIKKYFPNANLTTDVIVGFGNESQEQFENTKNFIIKCGFSFVHIFPYSKRKGTRAYNLPDLDTSIKKQRVDELEKVNIELKNIYLSKFLHQTSTMLAEEKKECWEGFSREYIRCYSDTELQQGKRYNIEFVDIYKDGMKIKVLSEV